MTTAAQQAKIDLLKSQIRGLEQQISALQPAEQTAKLKTAAAQNALDAFQATPGTTLSDLIAAQRAAAADPTNVQLQQQLKITQESWDARQSVYLPLLRARDAAFEQEVVQRKPIVDLESRIVDLEVEIVKIDPAQADPRAVEYAKSIGEFPITNVDPGDASIADSTADTRPTETSTVVTNPDGPGQGFVFDPNTGELVPNDSAQAREIQTEEQRVQPQSAVPGVFSITVDPEGTAPNNFAVWDNSRGVIVLSGLTETEAQSRVNEFNAGAADLAVSGAERVQNASAAAVDETYSAVFDAETQSWGVWANSRGVFVVTGLTQQEATLRAEELNAGDTLDPTTGITSTADQRAQDAALAAANEAAIRERARVQATLSNQIKQADSGDWRFKIRLAPGARYLYRGDDGQGVQSGILAPLAVTDGVIFPYTPNITTSYIARYAEQDLPHSNYRGYFYSGSYPEGITVQSVFTAQDTAEANYLLAVIHFFRSVTKMFYGQDDTFRGAPPPLVFLQGFGAYQYSRHPCVVTRFNFNLPADVDYIRADVQPITGLNIQQQRRPGGVPPQSLPTNVFTGAIARLRNAGTTKGAIFRPAAAETLGTLAPTYVPTKMDITIELLPMQTRQQVSQGFTMRDYATGNLLRKGFW